MNHTASSIQSFCYGCCGQWGRCECPNVDPDADDGFEFEGYCIVDPHVSVCGRFFVNPEVEYGQTYADWLASEVPYGALRNPRRDPKVKYTGASRT